MAKVCLYQYEDGAQMQKSISAIFVLFFEATCEMIMQSRYLI